jgi:thioredoxin reductase
MTDSSFDVIIVGGGPAGLSAALILGRCRRRVLVLDSGRPRNAASRGLHGFLTREGINPSEFLTIAREQLRPYETVELRMADVSRATCVARSFELKLANGEQFSCRKLLLATGVVDELPDIAGLKELYGRSVFHCPYCDGWEMLDQPLAVYGRGENGAGLALELTLWSRDLVLCTDGPSELTEGELARLARQNIEVREDRIERLDGDDGVLNEIVLTNGKTIPRRGMFFSAGQHQHSDLAEQLGCALTEEGSIDTGEYETTNVPGLYVAGDASCFVQFVIVAAAEGAQAAVAINKELMKEDLE